MRRLSYSALLAAVGGSLFLIPQDVFRGDPFAMFLAGALYGAIVLELLNQEK